MYNTLIQHYSMARLALRRFASRCCSLPVRRISGASRAQKDPMLEPPLELQQKSLAVPFMIWWLRNYARLSPQWSFAGLPYELQGDDVLKCGHLAGSLGTEARCSGAIANRQLCPASQTGSATGLQETIHTHRSVCSAAYAVCAAPSWSNLDHSENVLGIPSHTHQYFQSGTNVPLIQPSGRCYLVARTALVVLVFIVFRGQILFIRLKIGSLRYITWSQLISGVPSESHSGHTNI